MERISDYLLRGPGVWWEEMPDGITFFDGTEEVNYREVGPKVKDFKSATLLDINLYLHEEWEACISSGIELPALHLRCYKEDGRLEKLITYTDENVHSNLLSSSHVECSNPQPFPLVLSTPAGSPDDSASSPESTNECRELATPSFTLVHSSTPSITPRHSLTPFNSGYTHSASVDQLTPATHAYDPSQATPTAVSSQLTPLHSLMPSSQLVNPVVFKTSLATNLHSILQDSSIKLQKFDELRYALKTNAKQTPSDVLSYKTLRSEFERRVLSKYEQNPNHRVCKKILISEWNHKL